MNLEDEEEFDRPAFLHERTLAALEQQLYGHVRAAVDLDAISQLEHHLSLVLCEDFKLNTDLALDMSTQIIEAALRRVVDDPARAVSRGAPDGITEEEKEAVAFDATCPFCVAARAARERARSRSDDEEEEEDEYCACCEMLRESWREKHAEVLAKAGLARPSSASAIAGAVQIAKRDRARRGDPS